MFHYVFTYNTAIQDSSVFSQSLCNTTYVVPDPYPLVCHYTLSPILHTRIRGLLLTCPGSYTMHTEFILFLIIGGHLCHVWHCTRPFKFTSTVYEENFLVRVGTIDYTVDTKSGYICG
jgi:hypothetical protein